MKKTKHQQNQLNTRKNLDGDPKHLGYGQVEEEQEVEVVPHQNRMKNSIWIFSFILIGMAIVGGFFTTSYADEGTAEEVVANRISTSTVAGETLFTDETNANIEARDYEVSNVGSDGGEARMLIWDFNSEDLDEVAIFVDGMAVKERIILSNNAAAINIPVPSVVTIHGVKDNGTGISYAVKFPNNKTTHFNVVGVGQTNTYTVLPQL